MEEKVTAVYLMVLNSELTPEDGGKYDRRFEEQKRECLEFIKKQGIEETSPIAFYSSRKELLIDVERDRVARLVVRDKWRLSTFPEELDGILFELKMRCVELLSVDGEN